MRNLVILLCVLSLIVESTFSQSALVPTIQISANVYEYRLDSEKQLGLFYQYNRGHGSVQNSDIFLSGTENVKEQAIGALDLSGSFASFGYGSIDYNLKTAVEDGRANLINHQRVVVADGQRFGFTVGELTPLTVVEVKGSNVVLKTEDRATGIKLNGVPKIFRGTNVMIDLEIESSEITRIDAFDRGDGQRFTLPVITKRNVKTVVIVPSDHPVYVGGLYTNSNSDTTRKIPIVGDLPVIGFFLRGFNKKKKQTETIFRITPVIKKPGEGLDIGSSVFEELLQPENGKDLIQQDGTKNIGSTISDIPGSATGIRIFSVTESLNVPSPLIKSSTNSDTVPAEKEQILHPIKSDTNMKSRFNNSSKTWKNQN